MGRLTAYMRRSPRTCTRIPDTTNTAHFTIHHDSLGKWAESVYALNYSSRPRSLGFSARPRPAHTPGASAPPRHGLSGPTRPLEGLLPRVSGGQRLQPEEHLDARQRQASQATASAPVGLGRIVG